MAKRCPREKVAGNGYLIRQPKYAMVKLTLGLSEVKERKKEGKKQN